MPPKTASSSALTERQMQIISMAFASFESEPKVNFEKMATLLKLSSKTSAAARYGEAKKALREFTAGAAPADNMATTSDMDTGDGKKGAKKRSFDDGDAVNGTPSKKSDRKAKGKKVVQRENDAAETADYEEMEFT